MVNRQPPPSWYPDAINRDRVDAARGTVLDALGGLRNLEKLSGSMRVGPRSLSSVLPDVLASCEPMRAGLESLLSAVEAHRTEHHDALDSLRHFANPRVDELKEVLESSEKQPMQARNRLRLQQAISRIARELGATAELVDLLGLCVWSRPMTVTMQDLILEAFRATEPTGDLSELRRIKLTQTTGEAELHVRPRAVIPMLVLQVRLMLSRHPDSTPHVLVEPESNGISRIVISPGSETGEGRWILNRPIIPAASECLETAARTLEVGLQIVQEPYQLITSFKVTPLSQSS